MKQVFTFILLSVALSVTFGVSAQTLGLRAGFGSSRLAVDYYGFYGYGSETSGIFSGNLGLVAEVPFSERIIGMPSLEFNRRGGRVGGPLSLSYLTLTLPATYQFELGKSAVFGGLGPYVGYALGGRWRYGSIREKLEFGPAGLNRVDVGLTLLSGYKFSLPGVNSAAKYPFAAYIQYAFGLTNLGRGVDDDFDEFGLRNGGTFTIGALYYFGGKQTGTRP